MCEFRGKTRSEHYLSMKYMGRCAHRAAWLWVTAEAIFIDLVAVLLVPVYK